MTRKTVGGTWKEIARRFLHRATWDRKSECERRKDIVARKRSYATRRTYDRITRNTEKEREKERSSYRGDREERKEGRRNVVTSLVTSATRSTPAAMHSWKNGVRAGRNDHTNARGDGREVDNEKRGVATSRKDAVVERERGERRRGSMEGKKERCRKAEGGRASREKERERERKDRRGELPATRSPSIPR